MRYSARLGRGVLALACLGCALATPLGAAGFGIFEHGSKAMGMAGAFTAQADDPSAMFHNVGGLAFLERRELMLGTTLITNTKGDFQGAAPFPGPGVREEQADVVFFPSHLYWVQPLGGAFTFGLSFFTPFGLATEWDDVDNFSGRFISYQAELTSFDLTPNLGWRVNPDFGVGVGLVSRVSMVELRQRGGLVNPFDFRVVDVADVRLESDTEIDFGFTAGVLHRYNPSFSWGLSYRSKVKTDYGGSARFTQISTGNPQLDALVAQGLPFGQDIPVATTVEFPDMASLGLAFAITPQTLIEIDVNWTGWSSFDRLLVEFDHPQVETVDRPEQWRDVYNYRVGVRWDRSPRSQWRIGYVYDETPQPERAAGPLLPDSDRQGYTIGYGHRGTRFSGDFALMYLPFKTREVRESFDNYFGTYDTTAWLLGITVGWR
jgi:long-chain fatty acid transport protein